MLKLLIVLCVVHFTVVVNSRTDVVINTYRNNIKSKIATTIQSVKKNAQDIAKQIQEQRANLVPMKNKFLSNGTLGYVNRIKKVHYYANNIEGVDLSKCKFNLTELNAHVKAFDNALNRMLSCIHNKQYANYLNNEGIMKDVDSAIIRLKELTDNVEHCTKKFKIPKSYSCIINIEDELKSDFAKFNTRLADWNIKHRSYNEKYLHFYENCTRVDNIDDVIKKTMRVAKKIENCLPQYKKLLLFCRQRLSTKNEEYF